MKSINFRFKSIHKVVKTSNYISKVIDSNCKSVFISRMMVSCIKWSPSPEYQYLHFACCHSFRLTRKFFDFTALCPHMGSDVCFDCFSADRCIGEVVDIG